MVLAVNKMDLVDYSAEVFERISEEFAAFAAQLDIGDLTFIPISALHGDNVVEPVGQHALVRRALAAAPPGARAHRLGPQPDRRPVPGAVRHPAARATDAELHDYRGYAGQVAGGVLKPGDEVLHLPSGFATKVQP